MMAFRCFATFLLSAVLFAPAPLNAQVPNAARRPIGDRLQPAIAALRTYADTSGVAGLSAAIAVQGRIVWAGGFGYADVENRVPMTAGTVSRIGSISKPVAAAGAMMLVDRGRLALDVPISKYLPQYPPPQARMTLRQLMSHTAGVRGYQDNEFLSNERYDDVVSPLRVFWNDSLLFEPGTRYSYSTYGYTVVSAVTEAAAGRPWVAFMSEEVFKPLGLTSMQPEWNDSIIPQRASYYHLTERRRLINAPAVDISNKWAGGGLVSNVSDVVNFALSLLEGRAMSAKSRAESWRRQTPAGQPAYGLGWSIGEISGRRAVSHSGSSAGATSMLSVLPDDSIVVAVLSNTSGVNHARIVGHVASILLGVAN